MLANLVCVAARHSHCEFGATILAKITEPESRVSAIEDLAPRCPGARRLLGEARQLIVQLPPESHATRGEPHRIFDACLGAGMFDDALAVWEWFEEPLHRASKAAELVRRFGAAQPRSEMLDLLLRARQLAAGLDDLEDRDSALARVANAYVALDAAQEWREVFASIESPEYRVDALLDWVARRKTEESLAELIRSSRDVVGLTDTSGLGWSLGEAIDVCFRIGRADVVVEIVSILREGSLDGWPIARCCESLLWHGELGLAQQVADSIRTTWL
jgi:hypothetical protein